MVLLRLPGLRHHLHAGVQDFLAGHGELGLAAAEELGKQLAEMAVDGIEGLLQQFAGFAVDLADRVFQGFDGGHQVLVLRIEEALAFARGVQLVQRGQVDRAQRLDLARDARDFRLQPAGAAPFVGLVGQLLGQRLAVDLAGVELLGELFLGQAGGLLLQLQFGDAGAARLQQAFLRQAILVGPAQQGRQIVHFLARARQRVLALGAQFQRVLQAGLRGRGVQLGQVGLELFEFDIGALALIGGQLAVALQVSDADLDAAFGEFRLLRGALQFAQPGASGLGLGGQGLAFDLGVGETRLMLGQFLVQRFEAGLGFLARGAQVFLVGRDFLQVLAQARGALAGLLGLLLQANARAGCRARGA